MRKSALHRRAFAAACVILLAATLILVREHTRIPDGHMTVRFFDVGQGDSALLVSPSGKTVLIDSGPDLSALEALGTALPLSKKSIDLLILSHPDPDHFTAFPEVLRRFRVGALMLPDVRNDETPYLSLLAIAKEQGVPLVPADPHRDLDLKDGVTLDILWPPDPAPLAEDNDNSIVLRAAFGTGSILFTGDLSVKGEEVLLASGIDVSAHVLKVGHHGSRFSSSDAFLAAVHPRLAVISVGKDNHYGHPNPETLGRLEKAGIPVRSTMGEGEIDLIF
ncbi:MAG: ComEC/Rec2 family competence protein [Candidatus Peribacteraceae bacterium]|nr:ComEC/Rec2 family competence protein [Candidatus Peribacteraceae bacterium]MDD5741847.1 ComEC/Rec2 family competence protein [Candidatus Peribacteraceae bacterium]